MPTVADADATMLILKSYLVAQFAGDHATAFEPYTVRVELQSKLDSEAEQVGGPIVLLNVAGEGDADYGTWGLYARAVSISVEARATDFSGAAEGTANAKSTARRMAQSLCEMVREGYVTLRDSGLLNPTITTSTHRQREGEAQVGHLAPLTFNCVIFTQ